jgi:arabinosyltransferase
VFVAPGLVLEEGEAPIHLGVLPLSRFLNGHTFFVQHAHTLPMAPSPLAVHMTYQFAEGARFAYGKRQRLREAQLWMVDDEHYYNRQFVMAQPSAANLPVQEFGPRAHSREAVEYHLREGRHRSLVLRALLGIGKALGREVILPRMLCYCDYMWKEMKACRVGGAEQMRLPFDCPMDHALDTPRWFDQNTLGVGVREPSFLSNRRIPANVSNSRALVKLGGRARTDVQLRGALAPFRHVGILEIVDPIGSFCGMADPMADAAFKAESNRLLVYRRTAFCMEDDARGVPGYSQCCSPRKAGDKFFPCLHGFDPPEPLPACESHGDASLLSSPLAPES